MRTQAAGSLTRLSQHLSVHRGPINVGIIQDGPSALLIDFGPGEVMDDCLRLGIEDLQMILFTHHHRDQACGAHLVERGCKLLVPENERTLFEDAASYWERPENRWHVYNYHPYHLVPVQSLHVDRALREGDRLDWGPASISVLNTPGHTNGSVSYVVEIDGGKVVFCGDLIHSPGKVWEIYSLQKGTTTTDYHGFMGARHELVASLEKIKNARPSLLVPSHGWIAGKPDRAIDLAVRRLERCFDLYASSSALRFYFPSLFPHHLSGPNVMPIRDCRAVPEFLSHFGTTWMLLSNDRGAFVMDCGSPAVVEWIRDLISMGIVRRVEALWISHYHDDHVDAAAQFKREFGCPVVADARVAEIIENPLAWRLACASPTEVPVDRKTADGESWRWHEFTMTAYHLPGQTLYHGGLVVEGRGLRLFFSGDSFTPGGMDDYCAWNRNFLGKGVGFDLCLDLIGRLKPDLVFNSHIEKGFDFTPAQLGFMRRNLARRFKEYGKLMAWDDPNYGMDGCWVQCHPYEQKLEPGQRASLDVLITNHSATARRVRCVVTFPRSWHTPRTASREAMIGARREGIVALSWEVPRGAPEGRFVLPLDLTYGGRSLAQAAEAIVRIL